MSPGHCGESHPDRPEVTCTRPASPPCRWIHYSEQYRLDWDAPAPSPQETARPSRIQASLRRIEMIDRIPRARRTGPPDLTEVYAKDQGMAQAEAGTPEDFRRAFLEALRGLAQTRERYTSDDVWEILEAQGIDTDSRAGVGPLMAQAARRGWAEKSGEHAVSTRPNSKSRDGLTVWRSLLYPPQ